MKKLTKIQTEKKVVTLQKLLTTNSLPTKKLFTSLEVDFGLSKLKIELTYGGLQYDYQEYRRASLDSKTWTKTNGTFLGELYNTDEEILNRIFKHQQALGLIRQNKIDSIFE